MVFLLPPTAVVLKSQPSHVCRREYSKILSTFDSLRIIETLQCKFAPELLLDAYDFPNTLATDVHQNCNPTPSFVLDRRTPCIPREAPRAFVQTRDTYNLSQDARKPCTFSIFFVTNPVELQHYHVGNTVRWTLRILGKDNGAIAQMVRKNDVAACMV